MTIEEEDLHKKLRKIETGKHDLGYSENKIQNNEEIIFQKSLINIKTNRGQRPGIMLKIN